MIFNNNNNRRGPTASTRTGTPISMTNQHGQCRNVVRAFLSWVLPIPATPPYAVRPLHMHGAPDYGGYHFGVWNVLAARLVEHVWGAPRRPRRLESGQVRLVADFGAGSGRQGG